jgi:flagellin-like hook-associated protein FlgL
MRINNASDDAAGLAIAADLQAKTRIYTQSLRNIDDGISAITIAEGALGALTDIVTRQLELAHQASNSTISLTQRRALDREADALTKEFNRVIKSTQFNDMALLDNSSPRLAIQAGIGNTSVLNIGLTNKLTRTVGTGDFQAPTSVSVGASTAPVSSASADIDGDGDLDVVTANSGSSTASVMLNDGAGTFTLGSTLSTQDRVSDVRIQDFNGDGKLDVLATNYGSIGAGTSISTFYGNGNGTFQAGVLTTIGIGPSALATGDVNNDGTIDVLTTTATINFTSALNEITEVTLPTNGTTQINTVTFPGVSVREVTSITATSIADREVSSINAVAVGVREVSTVNTIAVATQEVSSINAVAIGVREVSSVTAIAVAQREVSQLNLPDASSITTGQYFTLSSGGVDYYTWFNVNGGGGDPALGGQTGIQVNVNSTDTADQVASAVAAALNGTGAFSTSTATNTVTVTNTTGGAVTDTANGNVGGAFSASTTTQGTNSALSAGDYFSFSTASGNYYVWFRINGAGVDPAPGGTGLMVNLNWDDSASTVASAIAAVIDPLSDAQASAVGSTLTITNAVSGNVTDIADGTIGGAFSASVTTQGTNSPVAAGDYFTFDTPAGNYYAWFRINGTGTDPLVGGRTGVAINVNWGDSANTVASAISSALDPLAAVSASAAGSTVTLTNAAGGAVGDIADVNVGGAFSVSTTTQGVNSFLAAGDYFSFSTASSNYYVWFRINGTGADPAPGGTGLVVDLNWGDSANTVASAIAAVIDPLSDAIATSVGSAVTITNSAAGNVTNIADGNVGGAFSVGVTTSGVNSPIAVGDYFNFDTPSGNYYAWFRINGTGTDPLIGGRTGVAIDVNWGDSANTVATAIASALDPLAPVTATSIGSTVTLSNITGGAVTDIADINVGAAFSVSATTQGTTSSIVAGDYFNFDTPSGNYYAWFRINGTGTDPLVGGRTGVAIDVNWSDSANTVATAIAAALDPLAPVTASSVGSVVTLSNVAGGAVTNASDVNIGAPFNIAVTTDGTTTGITNGSYFNIDTPSTDYYVWFNIAGGGVDPLVGGRTGLRVDLNWDDSANTVAAAVAAVVNPVSELNSSSVGAVTTISGQINGIGSVTNGTATGLTISTSQTGTTPPITSGQYFLLDSSTSQYYVWYNVAGGGGDPLVGGRIGLQVNINNGDSATSIAAATAAIINPRAELTASSVAGLVTISDVNNGTVPDAANFNVGSTTVVTAQDGSASAVDIVTESITANNHGLTTGTQIQLSTTGTLPGGLSTATNYWVIQVDSNTLKLASSLANAMTNNPINLTTFGSGTHSISSSGNASGGSVLLGNGNGTYQPFTQFSLGATPTAIQLVDVNRDGRLDLLASDSQSNGVIVRIGSGDGSFSSASSFATGTDPRSLQTGDFNRDGLVDVVVANYNASAGSSLSMLTGRGDGTFDAAVNYTVGTGPYDLAVADINGDGLSDLVTSNYQAGTGTSVNTLLGNGDGTFRSAVTSTALAGPISLTVGDYTGDGAADIATVQRAAATLSILGAITEQTTLAPQISLLSRTDALAAIDSLDQILGRVSEQRSSIGADLSRLTAARSNLVTHRDALREAASRITDVDVAEEFSQYARLKILQQTGYAIISQANQIPSLALKLLGVK